MFLFVRIILIVTIEKLMAILHVLHFVVVIIIFFRTTIAVNQFSFAVRVHFANCVGDLMPYVVHGDFLFVFLRIAAMVKSYFFATLVT